MASSDGTRGMFYKFHVSMGQRTWKRVLPRDAGKAETKPKDVSND